ncbi:MAG: hypothetical protein VBE63_11205 [Lamprobacter sp.]|uniref:hypothetical protein n=1 Tax=Lamprobacter sp. TaxID=3100796 RepID=UPI002B2630C4|nr:hypothetical protein [Lamprobacter sp.]MEA3640499.1 hypothetical protein [Lamprobacter sp.]
MSRATWASEHEHEQLLSAANQVLMALRTGDFNRLSEQIHENTGVGMSPYSRNLTELFVVKFNREQVIAFDDDETLYLWGRYDGIGDPIRLTAKSYFKEFVYDIDYSSMAKVYVIPSEKKIPAEFSALRAAYPHASIVHYHYQGSEDVAHNDFRDLLMLFDQIDNRWFLIGISHGERTI